MELTDAELYEGLSKREIKTRRREARQAYGPQIIGQTEKKLRQLTPAEWQVVKAEGDAIPRALADLGEQSPSDPMVQALIHRHHAWIENFYPAPRSLYQGLGQLYTTHPRFRAHYDQYRPGLADFMNTAMQIYCNHMDDTSGNAL